MREFGVPPVVDGSRTLLDPLADRAAAEPRTTAIRVNRFGRWMPVTCEQLHDEAITIAKGLAAAGVQPGDRIAIQSRNRPEWIVSEYAIWHAGAISVPIAPSASAGQVEWILSDSGAVGLFAGAAGQREGFQKIRHRLPNVRHTWAFDDGDLWSLAESGEIVGDDDLELRRGTVNAATAATISYASGAAEQPAGCVLTHGALGHRADSVARCLPEVFHREASLLLSLPLHDTFARILHLAAISAGAQCGSCDGLDLLDEFGRFHPTSIGTSADLLAAIIERARANADRAGLRRMFDRAAQCAVRFGRAAPGQPDLRLRLEHAAFGPLVFRNLRDDLGGRLDFALVHDSSLDPDLASFFGGLGIGVLRGHGTPEAGGASHLNLPGATRTGSVGRPLPGTTTRIDSDGEILLLGPGLFDGYWNNQAATLEVLGGDGWLATHQVGSLDDDGFLYLTGRKESAGAQPARLPAGSARP